MLFRWKRKKSVFVFHLKKKKIMISSSLFLIFCFCCVASILLFNSNNKVDAQLPGEVPPKFAPLNFKFVADIEVAWNPNPSSSNSTAMRTSSARVFGDPTTEGFPCVLVTANRTQIALPQNFDLARVTVCGQPAVKMRFSQLDPEFQMLARVCGTMKYPTTWATPLVQQQLAGVPVYAGSAPCQPTPDTFCQCTCRYAFDPPQWVGQAQSSLRAQEITDCPSKCFPDAFITILSMMKIKMTPEMVIGNCDDALPPDYVVYRTAADRVGWNINNNQNSDGTSITYIFGAPTEFPTLPQTFNANFRVTLIEYGVSIEFNQLFNSYAQAARTTVFNVAGTGPQEYATNDVYITQGTPQMVYRVQENTIGGDNYADYRYESTCERMLFSEDAFASSVQRLLLVPSTAPPVFVGRYTVRGVPTNLWSQTVSATLKVEWYFPLAETTSYNNADPFAAETPWYKYGDGTLLPRRIVLRGAGRSPFFAHHPFIPTTANIKSVDAAYCERMPFFLDPHCAGDQVPASANYQHVIEIAELPRYIAENTSLYVAPRVCSSATILTSTVDTGVNPALVFFLALLTFLVGIGCARMWCPGVEKKEGVDDNENVPHPAAISTSTAPPGAAETYSPRN